MTPEENRNASAVSTYAGVYQLPTEIWDMCWEHSSREQLHALSLTCRQFRAICQTRMFNSLYALMSFYYLEQPTNLEKRLKLEFRRQTKRFHRLAQPEMACLRTMVRQWDFQGSDHYVKLADIDNAYSFDPYTTAYETFIHHLPKYTHLHTLFPATWLLVTRCSTPCKY